MRKIYAERAASFIYKSANLLHTSKHIHFPHSFRSNLNLPSPPFNLLQQLYNTLLNRLVRLLPLFWCITLISIIPWMKHNDFCAEQFADLATLQDALFRCLTFFFLARIEIHEILCVNA